MHKVNVMIVAWVEGHVFSISIIMGASNSDVFK